MMVNWDEVSTIIGETIGQASMCWTETPIGVFDSTRAQLVWSEAMERLQQVIREGEKEE